MPPVDLHRTLGVVLSVLGPLLLLAACDGSSVTAKPSPQTIETAQSASRSVTITARLSITPESGERADGTVQLAGHVFGSGTTGVILAHMRPADQTSWFDFATRLASTGRFTALTFDFRGFGESGGEKEFDRIDEDLASAYAYMRDSLGISKIFLVGASMGGTASLIVGAKVPVEGVISISSEAQWETLDATQSVGSIRAPKLFVVSESDVPAVNSFHELVDAASDPKDTQVYDGDAHGTNLFDTPHSDELKQRILDFLTSN